MMYSVLKVIKTKTNISKEDFQKILVEMDNFLLTKGCIVLTGLSDGDTSPKYEKGYEKGFEEGLKKGVDLGYTKGYEFGSELGYNEGFTEGRNLDEDDDDDDDDDDGKDFWV